MAGIEHVVVLALENRSFDHMLGYLPHPDPAFDGLPTGGPWTNPGWDGGPPVAPSPGAKAVLPVGPEHGHDFVMEQLGIPNARPPWRPTNTGFVVNYERTCRNLPYRRCSGLLSPIVNLLWARRQAGEAHIAGRGPLIMLSQPPESVPVLSRLALEFAVCTRWFASVPGETWPNRNYLHAATSDGETNIDTRLYENPTIFERLEEAGRTWRIYHDDTPQVWAFKALWDREDRHANWFPFGAFAGHVAAGDLPAYAFIEPNHRPPLHTLDHEPLVGAADVSNNQHPENNLVSNDAYDGFPTSGQDTDFARGEALIANVYEALRRNPDLFDTTLLVVTYDEHGGFFDHVVPPAEVPAPSRRSTQDLGTRLLHLLYHRASEAFDFTMLGVRVPAVVVSPLVPRGTVDATVRDHASVPSTLRALFAPAGDYLTHRDRWSPPFHGLASLAEPRRDLADLSAYARDLPAPPPNAAAPAGAPAVPPYYENFARLAREVDAHLKKVGEPEAAGRLVAGDAGSAAEVSAVFASAAERHRREHPSGQGASGSA